MGEIPDDLNGVYVRNGPNPQHEPNGRYHWFDGDGMVHSVHIADGQATYRNRWVRTDGFEREREAGAPLWKGIIEPLGENPPGEPEKDTANTDLVFHNERLLALWYRAGKPYALDPVTLETLGAEDFDGTLRCEVSAHAKVDERTGELMFFDYGMKPPYMRYGVVSPEGVVRHFVGIDLPGPRLPHDMAITERHSILMDLPLFNDPEAARHGRFKLFFDRDMPSRFGVIPRYGNSCQIRWFEADAVLHLPLGERLGGGRRGRAGRLPREAAGAAHRPRGPARERALLPAPRRAPAPLPVQPAHRQDDRADDRRRQQRVPVDQQQRARARRSRYAYNMHISPESTLLFDGLMKYDVHTGARETHWFGDGRWGSEAPFAPRPGATEEDDGYLVSYVYDEREGRSEVEVLDARDVTAGPLCRIKLPMRVPIGFHATWVPGEKLPGGSA